MEVQHKTEGFDVITIGLVVLGQHGSCYCSRAAAPPPHFGVLCPCSFSQDISHTTGMWSPHSTGRHTSLLHAWPWWAPPSPGTGHSGGLRAFESDLSHDSSEETSPSLLPPRTEAVAQPHIAPAVVAAGDTSGNPWPPLSGVNGGTCLEPLRFTADCGCPAPQAALRSCHSLAK